MPEQRNGSVTATTVDAREEVCDAAKGVLLAIDAFLQENDWPDMPFGVHCALIILGEKMLALDEAMQNEVAS